ncbi:ATP-binding protein [Clostridium formicaceticum]|nr:ATP-binding protein [Clostridium formicaceticum]
MGFRGKAVLMLVAFIPLLIYLIFNTISISRTFLHMRENEVKEALSHAEKIFAFKGEVLATVIKPFASCETAYEKIIEGDKRWFQQNYGYNLYQKFQVDFVIVLDRDGQVFYQYDLFLGNDDPLGQTDKVENFTTSLLSTDKNNTYGLLKHREGIYIVAAAPIKPTDSDVKAKDMLIMGRKVTPQLLRYIEKEYGYKTFVSFNDKIITPYNHAKAEEEMRKKVEKYIKGFGLGESKVIENNEVMAKTVLKDIFDKPIGDLILIQSWDFYLATLSLVYKNAFKVFVISIIATILLSTWLNKFTMRPLEKIRNSIHEMSTSQTLNYIEIEGPNEIIDLAQVFNTMVENIQNEKRLNEDLREKLEYDNLKSEFLANVSHELRTPLNVILGSLQLWELENKYNQEQIKSNKHLKVMKQNCYRLLRLANNLIDMTKIDSGFLELRRNNYNIVAVVEDITMSVSEYIESHQIDLIFDTEIEEKFIFCDPDKIERIILNLLSNAVKCTKPGGKIEVNLKDQGGTILVFVKDTGIGIQEEKQKVIFERFRQVEDLLTRQHEGSGLGLTLTKSLVEMHEGTITLESKYGEGTTFIIELPAKVVSDREQVIFNKEDGLGPSQLERISIEFSDIYCS